MHYLFIYLFITFGGNQANPNSASALNLRDASMKCMETDLRAPMAPCHALLALLFRNVTSQVTTSIEWTLDLREQIPEAKALSKHHHPTYPLGLAQCL